MFGDWPSDWMIYGSLNCPGTDQLTEWFIANWIVLGLTICLNHVWLIELSGDWPTDSMIEGWLIDWLTDSTLRILTNWLNHLWLIDWLTYWLYCPRTKQLMRDFRLTELSVRGLTKLLNVLWLIDWLNNWLYWMISG